MKKRMKKLTLTKNTIAVLTPNQMGIRAGGTIGCPYGETIKPDKGGSSGNIITTDSYTGESKDGPCDSQVGACNTINVGSCIM